MTYKGAPLQSDRQDWGTPPAFMEFLKEVMSFEPTLDAAASASNTKAPTFFDGSEDCDGLTNPWAGDVWLNPPFGNELPLWLEKCAQEIKREEVNQILVLIPARTDTKWFQEIVMRDAWLVYLIKGRFNFLHGDACEAANAPFPSMLVKYRKHNLPDCGIVTLDVPAVSRGFGK